MHTVAVVEQVLDSIGDLKLVAPGWANVVHRLEHARVEHIDADEGKIADRLARLLHQPLDSAILHHGYAESLRIWYPLEQHLAVIATGDIFLYKGREAPFDHVIAQIHHEAVIAQEIL